MNIYKFFIYIKYFYYFHKLWFTLLVYKLHLIFFKTQSMKLTNILYNDIQNNGCIIIKLIQWLHTRYNTFYTETTDTNLYNLLSLFNNVFEKCNIHDLKYSKQLFKKEFPNNFYDQIIFDENFKIKSGSIAQVYKGILKSNKQEIAIKITHPDLNEQMLFPYLYFLLYNWLTNKIPLLNKYKIPFEMCDFFNNFSKQTNMINEAKNLKYFYKEYKNNPLILIPKPIIWSKNILIMEYIEATQFSKLEISDYIKYKIVMILNLFIKNGLTLSSIYHADLHNSNWKVIIENNNPKLVIYDFGFCIKTTLEERKLQQLMHKALELNNHKSMAKCMYKYLSNNPNNVDENTFINFTVDFMKKNKYNLYNNQTLKYVLGLYLKNNYILKSNILDILITLLLIDNYLKNYLYKTNVNTEIITTNSNYINKKLKNLYDQITTYIIFCETNNCFYKLQKYLSNYLIEIENCMDNNIDSDIKIYRKNKENRENRKNKENRENIKHRSNKSKINIEI